MLNKKFETLSEAGTCPTCGQDIDPALLLLDIKSRRDEAKAGLFEWVQKRDGTKAHIKEIKQELDECAAVEKKLADIPAKLAVAQESSKRAEAAEAELAAAEEKMARVQARIETGDFAHEAKAELDRIVLAISELGYNTEAHQRARGDVESLAPFEQEYQQLQEAKQQAADIRRKLDAAQESKRELEQAIEEAQQSAGEISTKAEGLKPEADGLQDAARAAATAKARKGTADMAVGAAQQKLADCEELKPESDRLKEERDRLAKQVGLYADLQKAFGKNGVPALIIDAALPEIESTANELLARLSHGRMHVRFDTQRDTLKGDTVETLDIQIADELGTRPYENFSGGEKFRANFAIRIALSKLLARRAGARLQTLVIDEGFGSLDSAGRGQLVEAINAASEDFDLILAVTHIDELRDMFDSRIEVAKTDGGSVVEVL